MDIEICGHGKVVPGEYGSISISGGGSIAGPVRCASLKAAGSAKAIGSVNCSGEVRCAGSAKFDGAVEAKSIKISGSVSGISLHVKDSIKMSGMAKFKGDICASDIYIDGNFKSDGNIEAETVRFDGSMQIKGLINGETVEIHLRQAGISRHHKPYDANTWKWMYADVPQVDSIGGAQITVRQEEVLASHGGMFFMRFGGNKHSEPRCLTVVDSIEGDEIDLEYTVCPRVSGKNVVIGPGCRVEEVSYSESIALSPEARVGNITKLGA